MKRIALFLGVTAVVMLLASVAMAKQEKVDVCHVPPDNPANAHTINVSPNAVPDHLAHGDTLAIAGLDEGPGGWFGDMTWADIADVWELNMAGADCGAFVLP